MIKIFFFLFLYWTHEVAQSRKKTNKKKGSNYFSVITFLLSLTFLNKNVDTSVSLSDVTEGNDDSTSRFYWERQNPAAGCSRRLHTVESLVINNVQFASVESPIDAKQSELNIKPSKFGEKKKKNALLSKCQSSNFQANLR